MFDLTPIWARYDRGEELLIGEIRALLHNAQQGWDYLSSRKVIGAANLGQDIVILQQMLHRQLRAIGCDPINRSRDIPLVWEVQLEMYRAQNREDGVDLAERARWDEAKIKAMFSDDADFSVSDVSHLFDALGYSVEFHMISHDARCRVCHGITCVAESKHVFKIEDWDQGK